jgi:hypothetical protein
MTRSTAEQSFVIKSVHTKDAYINSMDIVHMKHNITEVTFAEQGRFSLFKNPYRLKMLCMLWISSMRNIFYGILIETIRRCM